MDDEPIRAMLVEDNPGDAHLLRAYLSEIDGRPRIVLAHRVDRLEAALATLRDDPNIDVVLLDLMLPDSAGLATFREFRAAQPDVPVIVLSGLTDEIARQAVMEGAAASLAKSRIDPASLELAIRSAAQRHR